MKLTARIPVTAAMLALLLITATGCNRLKARDQLTKGVQAFKTHVMKRPSATSNSRSL